MDPAGVTAAGVTVRAAASVSRGGSASSLRGMDSGLLTCVARTFQPPGEAWLLSGFQNRPSFHKTPAEHRVPFVLLGLRGAVSFRPWGHDKRGF